MSNGLFDYLNSINQTKNDIMENESDYNNFMVARGLSYFPDTIMFANEINLYPSIDSRMHYDYLLHSVSSRKRFSKWFKPEKDQRIDVVMKLLECNRDKASAALEILPKEIIDKAMEIYSNK